MNFEIQTHRSHYYGFSYEEGFPDTNWMILVIQSLSPEYVEYHSSLENYVEFEGFEQPINLYSNFEGGHGVFTGYSTTYRFLDLSQTE